ncbi:MAG TPA: GerMN domain-containing protein [Selenomonadales bacterium]|nr:GerMN domain-containing protein [Selenomonadales bacterium]
MTGKIKTLVLVFALLIAALAAGCDAEKPVTVTPPPSAPAAGKEQTPAGTKEDSIRLTIYFATKDALYLVPEEHIVPKTSQPAHMAIEHLLAGPTSGELAKVMPEGTQLRSLRVKDHIAYVDFNDKLIKNNTGGSASEILIVGAVVDTLTQFPDIQKVRILVEGKAIDTISGHLDLTEPLSRSTDIIKKKQ